VGFDEACTVFDDPLAAIFSDDDHSIAEAREIVVGNSILGRLTLVCFVKRPESVIRVFSARLATRRERLDYETYANRRERP
jgi:uncharacterized DUF497 family protein